MTRGRNQGPEAPRHGGRGGVSDHDRGPGSILETVRKPKETKGFAVICRRRVVGRTFAWMSRCRRLAKDFERVSGEIPGRGAARDLPVPHGARSHGR